MKNKNAETSAESLIGRVLRPAELADYKPGSVVSRTIVDKKAGSVTLFSFDKGEGLISRGTTLSFSLC